MRTIRFALAVVTGLMLMLVIAANMASVDLHLLPQALGMRALSIKNVPLAVVIVGAVFFGVLLGFLFEYLREAKHRGMLAEKRLEIGRLRAENARLAKRGGAESDELSLLAG